MDSRSIDKAVEHMLGRRKPGDPETVWDREEGQKPHCTFGEQGFASWTANGAGGLMLSVLAIAK